MASINEFKRLKQKCFKSAEQLKNYSNNYHNIVDDKIIREKFGFYLLMLENITGVQDTSDILKMILDTDFNNTLFGNKSNDRGVDAYYIEKDSTNGNVIHLFNFKYREKFNQDKEQSLNESFLSSKFINALISEKIDNLNGSVKNAAKEIIDALNSEDVYKFILHIISNENKTLSKDTDELLQLKNLYDLEIDTIGLNEISELLLVRPEAVNATLLLDSDSVMSYREDAINSNVSYIIKLNLFDLLRITCKNNKLREATYLNDDEAKSINLQDIDLSILYDNVRGFVTKSKFNIGINKTLYDEPNKFFLYNNGITIIAKDIVAEHVNARKKYKITLSDFQVINGGQTLRTLHNFNKENPDHYEKLSSAQVLVRAFKFYNDEERNKIAEYTNSQNSISNIDLRSIRTEQILLEKYLADEEILYSRKKGDLGHEDKQYEFKISMEKLGQILFSLKNPHQASNKKKEIFGELYDDVFGDNNFIIEKSPDYIRKYFMIEKEYNNYSIQNKTITSDQKYFYIIYMIYNYTDYQENITLAITDLEDIIKRYKANNISDARKLIQVGFKDFLDSELKSKFDPK